MKRLLGCLPVVALVWVAACADTAPVESPSPSPAPSAVANARPNVLLYLIDTLRADRVGAYGYEAPTTPALDALAGEGLVFEQAYAPGPWTLPSVVSLMLSQPMCRHGVVVDGMKISARATPLAAVLGEAGYATASFIANSYAGRPAGLERGFDVYEGPIDEPAPSVGAFLDETKDQPFFIYMHDVRPHDPHEATQESLAPFGHVDPKTLKRIRNRSLQYRRLTRVDHTAGTPLGSTENTNEQTAALTRLDELAASYGHAYDARIREADRKLAQTLDQLRSRGQLANTLVIVVSDHGEELGEHGGWLHDHSVYDEVVRAPFIIRLPGGELGGTRINAAVSLLDVAPTIAELTDTPTPSDAFEGRSLAPFVAQPHGATNGPFVASMRMNRKKYYRPWKRSRGDQNLVVRDGDWKAIWNVEPDTVELYDIAKDPGEKNDLRALEPQTATRLAAFARDYLERCKTRRTTPERPTPLSAEATERLRALGYVD